MALTAARRATALLRVQIGRAHAVLTGRGAAGIEIALRGWGLHDTWIGIPANTCYIVLWAVLRSGNLPYLLDIDPQTGNLSPSILATIPSNIHLAAIIPTHLYGIPAPISEICAWAAAYDVRVIEDAALAYGARMEGRPAGAWGDASILSFGDGKNIDHGIGGALLTDDAALAKAAQRWSDNSPRWDAALQKRAHHWLTLYWALHQCEDDPAIPPLYAPLFAAYSDLTRFRLSSSEWDKLPAHLSGVEAERKHRLAVAELYDAELLDNSYPFFTPHRPEGSTLWRYPLLVPAEQRDGLLETLWSGGYHEVTRWYPSLTRMTATLCPDLPPFAVPHADKWGERILNLPLGEATTPDYIQHLCNAIGSFFDIMS